MTKGPVQNAVNLPHHSAYTDPKFGCYSTREFVASTESVGDPNKAAERFYELAHLPEPPLRFSIGKDAIFSAKEYLRKVATDVDKYESWSEGIGFDQM